MREKFSPCSCHLTDCNHPLLGARACGGGEVSHSTFSDLRLTLALYYLKLRRETQHFCLSLNGRHSLLPTHKGTECSQGFSSSLYNSHGETKFLDWWNISGMRKFPAPLPSQLISGLHQCRILGTTVSPSSRRFLPSVI